MNGLEKVVIVEGKSDKQKVEKIINEDVKIICTNGTLGIERLEQLILENDLDNKDVYLLVDEDDSGYKLRKQFRVEIPHLQHIYVDKAYREVAATPDYLLATAIVGANLAVNPDFLKN